MFWCTEQDFLILERNTYQIRMQAINMAETERDPRCGEGTGGLFAPEEGIWEEWKG